MNDLCLPEYDKLIKELVKRHLDANVEYVDNLERLGMACWNSSTEKPLIRLKTNISAEEIDNDLTVVWMNGSKDIHNYLHNERDFLIHLVLHEVCHVLHDWENDKEHDCDRWALQQAGKIIDLDIG